MKTAVKEMLGMQPSDVPTTEADVSTLKPGPASDRPPARGRWCSARFVEVVSGYYGVYLVADWLRLRFIRVGGFFNVVPVKTGMLTLNWVFVPVLPSNAPNRTGIPGQTAAVARGPVFTGTTLMGWRLRQTSGRRQPNRQIPAPHSQAKTSPNAAPVPTLYLCRTNRQFSGTFRPRAA